MGDEARAAAEFAKAVELDPKDIESQAALEMLAESKSEG